VAKPITIPNTFAAATSAIPLSQLDQDFSTLANSTNDLATYSNYVADTGAANAFIANYPANINTSSLTTGLRLQFKAANANTGASTLNVQVNGGSIGTAAIRLTDGSALPANTIVSGAIVDVMYDGTNFQLMNDPSGGQEVITNLTLSGNLTVTGTSNFTGNVTANVANTTTSTITNLSSGNVTITGGTISNVTLDNVTVDVETFSNITINGTATFAAGTVSAPSITTSGDTNTGIYFPAADTIALSAGGVQQIQFGTSGAVTTPNGLNFDSNTLVIDATNNRVGIGTNSPAYTFEVTNFAYVTGAGGRAWQAVDTTASTIVGFGVSSTGGYMFTSQAVPLFFSTSGTERMRITSAGVALVGKTATGLTTQGIQLVPSGSSAFTGPSGSVPLYINNIGTSSQSLIEFRTGTAATTVPGSITTDGTNLAINGYTNLIFGTNSTTERMRIDSSGNLLVAITATQNISGVNTDHTFAGTTSTGRWVCGFINSSASSPYGLAVNYTGSAPNATGNQFLFCRDTGGTRFEVRSNGGIANYSANDINLSDEREKTNIQLAGSYLDKICAIPIKTFKYIDQNRETDDGLTLGVIAQDVQKVAPELVMESNWAAKDEPEKMRLSIYQTDLQYALMKCIQEQQAMIEELKQEVDKLKGV
jgi:hypothetical protein